MGEGRTSPNDIRKKVTPGGQPSVFLGQAGGFQGSSRVPTCSTRLSGGSGVRTSTTVTVVPVLLRRMIPTANRPCSMNLIAVPDGPDPAIGQPPSENPPAIISGA